jgi:SsrA-binding protein
MLITNKKVQFEYEIIEKYSCGIILSGSEVKSIKDNKVSIVDTYCYIKNCEMFVRNLNITTSEEKREIKLLLNKKEIKDIEKRMEKGLTIVPYKIYTNYKGLIKLEIVIGRGKKLYDKKQKLKERSIELTEKKELFNNF